MAGASDGQTEPAMSTGNRNGSPARVRPVTLLCQMAQLHEGILMIMRMIVNYFYNGQGRKREKTSVNPF